MTQWLKEKGLKDTWCNLCFLFIAIEILLSIFIMTFHKLSGTTFSVQIDLGNIGLSPFSEGHFLGTDHLGRDVLKQLFFGTKNTLFLSFMGTLLGSFVGITFGCFSGYFGDDKLKIKAAKFWIGGFLIIGLAFYAFNINTFRFSVLIDLLLPSAFLASVSLLIFLLIKSKKQIPIPFDLYVVRVVEVYSTIPPIFIIILLSSILRPSPALFIIYCVAAMWPEFFFLSRAELLKTKNQTYIDAARVIGQRNIPIVFRHIFPNMFQSLLVLFAFAFARLLVIESTLSFLGIGLPAQYPGWGKLIASFQMNTDYWWLLLFPGLLIFINVLCIQKIGRKLREN